MRTLSIKRLQGSINRAVNIPAALDEAGTSWQAIDCADWAKDYPYRPDVAFRMAHTGNALLLNFRVGERWIRAVADRTNGRPWEDSCCEFFSSPANDGYYYNMECNCAGALLVACGKEREGREQAPEDMVERIDRWSSLGCEPFDVREAPKTWQLALRIPTSAYFKHHPDTLSGLTMRANFYKCGDKLPQPHFLSWNPIKAPKPDFHLPQFFGLLNFE